jgi:hypothetical protein
MSEYSEDALDRDLSDYLDDVPLSRDNGTVRNIGIYESDRWMPDSCRPDDEIGAD